MTNDMRMQGIQSKSKAEKLEISALENMLSETVPYSKWKLRQAMSNLKEVETYLLLQAVKARREVDAVRWVDIAEFELAAAVKTRQEVQKDFDKFGPDMVEIGR
jgi:hypothetical protein